jgi:hypothetical protein
MILYSYLKLWTKSYGKNKSPGSIEGLLLVGEKDL